MPVGVKTVEKRFAYYKSGPAQGKLKETMELTGDLRPGARTARRGPRAAGDFRDTNEQVDAWIRRAKRAARLRRRIG